MSSYEGRDLQRRQSTCGPNINRFSVLAGVLNPALLEDALQQLALRHEALRTRFEADHTGVFTRRVEATADLRLQQIDLRAYEATDEAVKAQVRAAVNVGFAADAYPLARVSIFSVANNETVIVISVAELIADGQSVSILMRDLSELYEAQLAHRDTDLPPIEYGLSAFVASQVAWTHSAEYGERLHRLQERLHRQLSDSGGVEQLYFLPRTKESFLLDREFPADLACDVRRMASLAKVSIPTVLMAMTSIGIARARGAQGLFFTSTFSNRSVAGTAQLMGHLATTMPCFLSVANQRSLTECVQALHRDLFLLMSQFGMIPISEVGAGFAERYPSLPAGTTLKFGKVVMDVTPEEFPRMLGLESRAFVAGIPYGLGALCKFAFQASQSGKMHLWLRGLREPGNEELALQAVEYLMRPGLGR
ncbi:MAG TPA: condensation domain-containing protein [Rhodocyclaceae bacterium]|nr:condensation domain-containing protein [Rhodocyclaceae bacterium]